MKKFIKKNEVLIATFLFVGFIASLTIGFLTGTVLVAAASQVFIGAICVLPHLTD